MAERAPILVRTRAINSTEFYVSAIEIATGRIFQRVYTWLKGEADLRAYIEANFDRELEERLSPTKFFR